MTSLSFFFPQALSIRHQIAHILGYENHAAFQLEISLAKQPQKVMDVSHIFRDKEPSLRLIYIHHVQVSDGIKN
jgi:Zn-dependent oligopeptidase